MMSMMRTRKAIRRISDCGMTLVEAIVAVSVATLIVTSIIASYPVLLRTGLSTLDTVEAGLLIEDGIEGVKTLRDTSWSQKIAVLTASTTYRLAFATSTFESTTTTAYIDGHFDRTFALYSVYRDGSDNIAASGTLDPKARKLTVFVAWPRPSGTTTRSISTYITDLFGN